MNLDQLMSGTTASRDSMLRRERVALRKALREMVTDQKAGARFTDNDIRATAKRHGCDACSLYAAFVNMPEVEAAIAKINKGA